jgi:hypothetical protein
MRESASVNVRLELVVLEDKKRLGDEAYLP